MKLLFIDEELPVGEDYPGPREAGADTKPYMWYYRHALDVKKVKYEVVVSLDDAVQALRERPSEFDVISIDEIMPNGNGFSMEETRNTLRSGSALLKWIESNELSVFVFLFSNVPDELLTDELADFKPIHLAGFQILNKPKVKPLEFVAKILEAREEMKDG